MRAWRLWPGSGVSARTRPLKIDLSALTRVVTTPVRAILFVAAVAQQSPDRQALFLAQQIDGRYPGCLEGRQQGCQSGAQEHRGSRNCQSSGVSRTDLVKQRR